MKRPILVAFAMIVFLAAACTPQDEQGSADQTSPTTDVADRSAQEPTAVASPEPVPTPTAQSDAESDGGGTEPPAIEPDPEPAIAPVVDAPVLYNANGTGSFEIYQVAADGVVTQLTDDPAFDSFWARPSPDRSSFLFYRTPAGTNDQDYSLASMWMASADGSNPREILPVGAYGWSHQGHGEWSPDGTRLAMFAGGRSNPQIFTTDIAGTNPVQITNEGGTNVDPSWSPDGSNIVYAGCPQSVCFPADLEIYVVPSGGGERIRMTEDDVRDHDPYYSPNGQQIAFLTQTELPGGGRPAGIWDIRLVPAGGGPSTTLTASDNVTSLPRWAPDGSTIYTHQLRYGSGSAFDIVRIDAKTGAVDVVVATGASEEYPSP